MSGMFRFYWSCFTLAGNGVIGDFCTLISIALALEVWRGDEWVKDAKTLAFINALGGWMIPIGLLAGISAIRLLLAPYWLYKKQAEKLKSFETRRPSYRLQRGWIPNKPQIFSVEGGGPPAAVVTFELKFRNMGGETAYHPQFWIDYCWLKEPSVIMSSISAVSATETMPGEWFSWTFSAEQRPATRMHPTRDEWWFDREGLVMLVEITYLTQPGFLQAVSSPYWLYWHPRKGNTTSAGIGMVNLVWPHIEQYRKARHEAFVAASGNALTQPLSTPDTDWKLRLLKAYREIRAIFTEQ